MTKNQRKRISRDWAKKETQFISEYRKPRPIDKLRNTDTTSVFCRVRKSKLSRTTVFANYEQLPAVFIDGMAIVDQQISFADGCDSFADCKSARYSEETRRWVADEAEFKHLFC